MGNSRHRRRKARRKADRQRLLSSEQIGRRLQEAGELLTLGKTAAAYDKASQVAAAIDTADRTLFTKSRYCAAASAYLSGQYTAAESWIAAVEEGCGLSVELIALQAMIHAELGEPERCLRSSAAVARYLGQNPDYRFQGVADGVGLAQFYWALGRAHYELAQFAEAEAAFQAGIAVDGDRPHLYIGLAQARARRGDAAAERRAISDGLVNCADKGELLLLAAKYLGDETISLCMIVRNEENFLDRCLASVQGLVQEIIIVDTGSEDGTLSIAESHGARVYLHPWEDDFSKHRNQSISYATGDWILIMDADEELAREDHDKVRAATRIPDINAVSISVYNRNPETQEITSFLTSTRLWRRKLDAYYEGIVHNELRLPPEQPILRADVRLWHYGYGLAPDKMKKKIERTRKLLLRQLEAGPQNPFANFNYSQLLRGQSRQPSPKVCRLIIEHSQRTVANTNPASPAQRHLHVAALDQIAFAHFYLKEYDQAAAACLRALRIDPDYIDPKFNLGHIYAAQADYRKAVAAFTDYLDSACSYDAGSETDNYILLHANKQAEAHYGLGLVHERKGEDDQAIEHFLKVFDYRDDYLDTNARLARLYYNKGEYALAREHAARRVDTDGRDSAARFILAEVCRRQGDAQLACEHYGAVLELEPENSPALLGAIDAYRRLGDNGQALAAADRLLALNPNHQRALTVKGDLELSLGKYAEAAASYESLVNLNPTDADAQNNLGNCLFKQDDFGRAAECYRQALSLRPEMGIARRNLGVCCYKLKDYPGSLEQCIVYLDQNPEDLDILCLASRMLYDAERWPEAIGYLERCLRLDPESAQLLSLLADCYLRLGHYNSARLGYLQALRIDPQYEPASAMLAEMEAAGPQKL